MLQNEFSNSCRRAVDQNTPNAELMPSLRAMAASYAARWSSFCAGVKVRLDVGPPDRGPGLLLLLMKLSSRTAINDGVEMMGLPDLALRQTADLLLATGLTQP